MLRPGHPLSFELPVDSEDEGLVTGLRGSFSWVNHTVGLKAELGDWLKVCFQIGTTDELGLLCHTWGVWSCKQVMS